MTVKNARVGIPCTVYNSTATIKLYAFPKENAGIIENVVKINVCQNTNSTVRVYDTQLLSSDGNVDSASSVPIILSRIILKRSLETRDTAIAVERACQRVPM